MVAGGNIPFMREHTYFMWDPALLCKKPVDPVTLNLLGETSPRPKTNPTMMPDAYLNTWSPVFLIRHPALVVPSMARACKKAYGWDLTHRSYLESGSFRTQRLMYDWYADQLASSGSAAGSKRPGANYPLVIDADDIIKDASTMRALNESLGLDPEKVLFEWKETPKEKIEAQRLAHKVFWSSVQGSSGILLDKMAQGLTIEEEVPKWEKEWGVEGAQILKGYAEACMPDYEYLKGKRSFGLGATVAK
ncbi:hypothetical protein K402DRAFT_350680 [Aulographum hederae CBS 113979]|uniref:Uncharacterized protein n=1 Tax=Aulographum hederae CBS 113979 TaxID=1176131 RepID=A0A6G1H732_9PEZI|nr:hypothetical protein K402DRAFT_350680 [Aulographum hederae CBS 113979]